MAKKNDHEKDTVNCIDTCADDGNIHGAGKDGYFYQQVVMETSKGDIVLALYPTKPPSPLRTSWTTWKLVFTVRRFFTG